MAITTFIPELWNARLLYSLDKAHVAANLVNRNYEGEIKRMGDTVHINSIGAITINDYTKNTDISAPETLTTTDQELTINQGKYFNFQVDDVDKAQAAGAIIDTAMSRAAYGLADVADKFLLSTMAAGADSGNIIGTSAAAIALTATNVYEKVIDLRILLDKANVPTTDRFIVIPPEVYGLLLNDDLFVKASDTNAATARNGLVGDVGGLQVYISNNCPVLEGTDTSKTKYTQIIAGVSTATTYAEQILNTEAYRPEKRFADAVKGLHVYGAKVTDGKQLAVINATF